jgi:hypothetical protein
MKKVRVILVAAASVFAIGAALATSNPFVATKDYRVNGATGVVITPLTEVQVGYTCFDVAEHCAIRYTLLPNGQPNTSTGVPIDGRYTAP